VFGEDPHGVVPFGEPPAECALPDDEIAHPGRVATAFWPVRLRHRIDCLGGAAVPGARIPYREDRLGVREVIQEFLPVEASRPVDDRRVTVEDLVPAHVFAAGFPEPFILQGRVCRDVGHVMARPETEFA